VRAPLEHSALQVSQRVRPAALARTALQVPLHVSTVMLVHLPRPVVFPLALHAKTENFLSRVRRCARHVHWVSTKTTLLITATYALRETLQPAPVFRFAQLALLAHSCMPRDKAPVHLRRLAHMFLQLAPPTRVSAAQELFLARQESQNAAQLQLVASLFLEPRLALSAAPDITRSQAHRSAVVVLKATSRRVLV